MNINIKLIVGRNELISIISKLKNNKSTGPDNIGSKLVKDNVSVLVDPLIHLFNLSITTGVVPDKLKLAKVIPVYKNKGEIISPGNYCVCAELYCHPPHPQVADGGTASRYRG